jgi:hypothetical protein
VVCRVVEDSKDDSGHFEILAQQSPAVTEESHENLHLDSEPGTSRLQTIIARRQYYTNLVRYNRNEM